MTTKTKQRPQKARRGQHPQQKQKQPPLRHGLVALAIAALLVIGGAVVLTLLRDSGSSNGTPTAGGGLPDTPDYHSLLVSPTDANHLVLGTHNGLFESTDGGRIWAEAGLVRRDAMNLARGGGRVVWAAGHNVLAKSSDGGKSWSDVSPAGLPHLDVHGFSVDPRNGNTLYAAIANEGLYRSTNGGESFEPLSRDVGGAVMALAVVKDGTILAGDMGRGLLSSSDGGKTWRRVLNDPVMGLAVNPARPKRIVAAGRATYLSTDGGRSWKFTMALNEGAGPIAWAPSQPETAYLVGFDRLLYKSTNGGRSWRPVS